MNMDDMAYKKLMDDVDHDWVTLLVDGHDQLDKLSCESPIP